MGDITEEELKILKGAVGNRGRLIFAHVAGSACFNLATPTSDRDLFGVFLATERGPFQPPKSSIDSNNPDYAIYEVSKFVELLAKGNPKVVEPLFVKHLKWSAPEWEGAVAVRQDTLNQHTVKQYLSYSLQKLKAAKEALAANQAPWKDLYHALRLAKEANRISKGLEPMVFWEGEEREEIMKVRRGEVDPDTVMSSIQVLHLTAEAAMASLPQFLDKKGINDWAVNLKIKALTECKIDKIEFDKSPQTLNDFQTQLKERAEAILRENDLTAYIVFCAPTGSNALKQGLDNTLTLIH